MNNRSTREFANRMKRVRLEDEARARILDNVTERAHSEGEVPSQLAVHSQSGSPARNVKPTPRKAKPQARKPRTAIIAGIAACALAASIGAVGLTSLGGSDTGGGSALLAGQKAFALEAYAQGDLSKEPYHTTVLTENSLGNNVGGYFGHWQNLETGEVLDDVLGYWFRFDLTCIGNDVASYTYEIEGDGAYFGIIDMNHETPTVVGKYNIVDKALTIDADSQHDYGVGEGQRYIPGIIVSLPMDEEFAAVYEAALAADAAQSQALQDKVRNESAAEGEKADENALQQALDETNAQLSEASSGLDRQIETHAAARINGCKLHVTATYTDGTTETKTYEIAPVDNYDELLTSFLAEREAWMAENEDGSVSEERPEEPELYRITELEE